MRVRNVVAVMTYLLMPSSMAGGDPSSDRAVTHVKAQYWFPADHIITQYLYTDWKNIVEKESDGTIKVDLTEASFSPKNALAAVRNGSVDVVYHAAAYTPQTLPYSVSIAEFGPYFGDPLASILAATEMNLTDTQMQQQWRDAGVVYGGSFATPYYYLICRKPVQDLDDFKDLKVRIPSRSGREWTKSLGALPTLVDANAQEQAMASGSLDCTSTMLGNLKDRDLWRTAKHVLMLPLSAHWSGFAWAYNPDFWQRLTLDERRVLLVAQAKAQHRFIKALHDIEQEARAEFSERGVELHEGSPELQQHFNRFIQQHKQDIPNIARKQFGVKDSLNFLDRFDELYGKWMLQVKGKHYLNDSEINEFVVKDIYGKLDLKTYGIYR